MPLRIKFLALASCSLYAAKMRHREVNMKEADLIAIFTKQTEKELGGAPSDDFAPLINALSGLSMFIKTTDLNLFADNMAFPESSPAAAVLKKHTAEDAEDKIKDSYFARGYVDGNYRVMNKDEEVTPKNLLLRFRHALIYTQPNVDTVKKTIRFNDTTHFSDMGFWNQERVFAKDRKNPHRNHRVEKMEEFKAVFTFEEMKELLLGYCSLIRENYPMRLD